MRDRTVVVRGTRITLAALVLLVTLVALPSPAQAAFPGKNGKIAFTSDRDGNSEIYVMNADGTGQTRLTTNSASDGEPAWSPDGNKLAFHSSRDGNREIYVMNADGSNQTRLTNAPSRDDYEPAWSPDGTRIAFGCRGNTASYLCTMNADGSGLAGVFREGHDPAWSPDGRRIAYWFFAEFDDFGYIRTADPGGNGEQIFCCPPGGNPPPTGPNWAPDQRDIIFEYRSRIARQNVDGSGFAFLTPAVTTGGLHLSFPAYAPDGSKIAFTGSSMNDNDIYVMNRDGSGQTNLTQNAALDGNPDWQPIPINSYARPKSATPFEVSLVPAYAQCTAPNRRHGPPLGSDSCNPPTQTSDELTLGSPDANGKPVRATGDVKYTALNGDVRITVEIKDVYDQQPLGDYTGEVRVRAPLRITDKLNTPHPGGPGAATVSDASFGTTVSCTATADPNAGSDCSLLTTANTLVPGTVTAGKRAVWGMGQMQVDDGGADGDADTVADNTLFMVQGVFVP